MSLKTKISPIVRAELRHNTEAIAELGVAAPLRAPVATAPLPDTLRRRWVPVR
jgi:hypothetical protein